VFLSDDKSDEIIVSEFVEGVVEEDGVIEAARIKGQLDLRLSERILQSWVGNVGGSIEARNTDRQT